MRARLLSVPVVLALAGLCLHARPALASAARWKVTVLLLDRSTPAGDRDAIRDTIAGWLGAEGKIVDAPTTLGKSADRGRMCVTDAPCLRRLLPAGASAGLFMVVDSSTRALAVETFELPSGRSLGTLFVPSVARLAEAITKLGIGEPSRLLVRAPKGAILTVNGFVVGDSGMALPSLVPGSYEIEAEAPGGHSSSITFPLAARLAVAEISLGSSRKRTSPWLWAGVIGGAVVIAGAAVLVTVLLTRPDPPPDTDLGDFSVF